MSEDRGLSVVIPVFNEEANVAPLHAEVLDVCRTLGMAFEVIFVDDGSKDGTLSAIRRLRPVRCISLRRNFGQTAAIDAGIKAARYDLIVLMDGDRQNDPADIPRMIEHLKQDDLDVVSGWRKDRRDPFLKRFISGGANLLRKVFVRDQIRDSGCSLKLYKRECFETLTLYGEMHRFIPALLQSRGFRVGEIAVNHRARVAGRTKYNWRRVMRGLIDMISLWFWRNYATRPMHLLGGLGLSMLTLGGLAGLRTVWVYLQKQDLSNTVLPLLTVFLISMGLQIFVTGLILDMMMRSYFESTKDASYHVKVRFDVEEEPTPQAESYEIRVSRDEM